MYVEIEYWGKSPTDAKSGMYNTVEAYIEKSEYEKLFNEKSPRFVQFVIDDGEVMILKVELIGSMKQIYK